MKMEQDSYDDIINLDRPVSRKHRPMAIANRAAQFAPFAALTGHDAAIAETARLTKQQVHLDENSKEFLDEKLKILMAKLGEGKHPLVKITYFLPDLVKTGGSYQVLEGAIKRIDSYREAFVMMDKQLVFVKDIIALEGEGLEIWDEASGSYEIDVDRI